MEDYINIPENLRVWKKEPLPTNLLNINKSQYVKLSDIEYLLEKKCMKRKRHAKYPLYILTYNKHLKHSKWASFPSLLREASGLVVNECGQIITRPMVKFFNYDQTEKIPSGKGIVMEKMDGSIINLGFWDGKMVISSKGAFDSNQAIKANQIIQEKYQYFPFNQDYTYCFEIIYPQNKIVVDYGEITDLYLLAKINTQTGEETRDIEEGLKQPIVQYEFDHLSSLEHLLYIFHSFTNKHYTDNAEVKEGSVILFNENYIRVKMKHSEWYRLSKSKSHIKSTSYIK